LRCFRIAHPDRCIITYQKPTQATGKRIMLNVLPTFQNMNSLMSRGRRKIRAQPHSGIHRKAVLVLDCCSTFDSDLCRCPLRFVIVRPL
jgi:hypothetical protein